jgi:hypothetical protein
MGAAPEPSRKKIFRREDKSFIFILSKQIKYFDFIPIIIFFLYNSLAILRYSLTVTTILCNLHDDVSLLNVYCLSFLLTNWILVMSDWKLFINTGKVKWHTLI